MKNIKGGMRRPLLIVVLLSHDQRADNILGKKHQPDVGNETVNGVKACFFLKEEIGMLVDEYIRKKDNSAQNIENNQNYLYVPGVIENIFLFGILHD
jgi:hypothetical protein